MYRNVDRVKCVAVGDGAVGKTSLLITFTENRFPEEYVPTVFENYISTVEIDGNEISASLWDTAGQEELASLRSLSYPDTDIFLVCFSLVDETSLTSAHDKWIPEITERCADARLFIVGTKQDLKTANPTAPHIPSRDAIDSFCKAVGAVGYAECSAKTNEGVKEVFDQAVRAAMLIVEASTPLIEDPNPRKKTRGKKEKEREKEKEKEIHTSNNSNPTGQNPDTSSNPPPLNISNNGTSNNNGGKSPRPNKDQNLSGSSTPNQRDSAQPYQSSTSHSQEIVRKKNSKCAIL